MAETRPNRAARTIAAIAALVLLSACARGLTPAERDFADAFFGDTLDADAVQVTAGIGVLPLPRPRKPDPSVTPENPRKPPEGICERKRSTQRTWTWPAAFVLYDKVYFSFDYYLPDTFEGWPDAVPYPTALIMAHELMHVWQWQNRNLTNYTIAESASETTASVDPYWWTTEAGREFLSYGYEQQGAIVQDYVCYSLFDPDDPKRAELRAILSPVLPIHKFDAALRR